jgi:hypothetical protein
MATASHDPLERAMSYREEGLLRKHCSDFGFHPVNRGTLGISSHHVHEVAWSCLDGVQAQRYKVVDAVRVPSSVLDAWRLTNQQKCNSDMLMPKFSDTMRFALLTKTHFIHANKLNNDGNRTLFNKGDVTIKFKMEGSEAKKIFEDGFCVCLYKEELWYDKEALNALMRVDNEDADVQMKEDEMQFQGRVDDLINNMVIKGVDIDAASVLKTVTAAGLKTFKPEEALVFINFRLALSEGVGDLFLL